MINYNLLSTWEKNNHSMFCRCLSKIRNNPPATVAARVADDEILVVGEHCRVRQLQQGLPNLAPAVLAQAGLAAGSRMMNDSINSRNSEIAIGFAM
jgi:hypothetical protein